MMDFVSQRRLPLAWPALLPFCLLSGLPADANPTGGSVTQGSATFSSSGSTFNINQTSANAFINWQSFNIGAGETVNFNQPSASSVTFNQINQGNASQILGDINAQGYVVLENASGFSIGGQAVLTAHGLVLSTAVTPALNLSSGGPWSFDAPPPTAQIANFGTINITGGGSAFLIAADIVNNGTIIAPNGKIGLYDGETVLVSTTPNGQGLNAAVTLPQGSVDNEGNLTANGGTVVADAQFVNQNGVIQANTAANVNGTIELLGGSSVTLGASSAISATGDPNATSASAGGSVQIQAGTSFFDASGSSINVSGNTAYGGNAGSISISAPQMSALNSTLNAQAAAGYANGTLSIDTADIYLNSDGSAEQGALALEASALSSGFSQINLQASGDITLNTVLQLAGQTTPSALNLTAGNDITLNLSSGINAESDWVVNLKAGTAFVPTAAQPTPALKQDGIYLYGDPSPTSEDSSYIQSQNGNITLWAANEVQVGWSGNSVGIGQVNPGLGSISTTGGGSINVTTMFGDVNTGSDPNGYIFGSTIPYQAASNLGGISTALGGNVSIIAGGNVISYAPSGSLDPTGVAYDGGTGAFGTQPGNVTIVAGGSVFGHYVVTDGNGLITSLNGNIGAANGDQFALSLTSGGWDVIAPNGDIYLEEVRNPNGDFNEARGPIKIGQKTPAPNPYALLFTYSPQAYVDLSANGVYLGTSGDLPRLDNYNVPVLYPPILDVVAGSGGVTVTGNSTYGAGYVTLFPSPDQNLTIVTTDGGNFVGAANSSGENYGLLMSDSASSQWAGSATFSTLDHGSLANEPFDSTPVGIVVAGDMQNLNLITTKATDIFIDGDMINSGFSGQNLQASDATTITVLGQIYYTSYYSFVTLSQAFPNIPTQDLLPGMGESWNDIFTLAISASGLANFDFKTLPSSPAGWLNALLTDASVSLFDDVDINNQLAAQTSPKFVYNPATGQFGFAGTMSANTLSQLTQPITILRLVNGQPVPIMNGTTIVGFETDTVSWAPASAVQTLFTESQGRPTPGVGAPAFGLELGGPGSFDINAGSIELGNSFGIFSCGVDDADSLGRYGNLAPITPAAATLNITVTGPDQPTDPSQPVGPNNPLVSSLDMLTSTIANLGGGSVNVFDTGGSMDLGAADLFAATSGSPAYGVYTTGGGEVNVTALGDVNIDGSRIASYNGGNIFVESLTGDVNVGSGNNDLVHVQDNFTLPGSGLAADYDEDVYGSGIVAVTLVPPSQGVTFPPNPATVPGNITVETPQGSIVTSSAGILQESLNGTFPTGPFVTLTAGSAGYVGNIDLGNSGVIGGTVNLSANGNITGQIVSSGNSTVNAAQSFSGTILSGGSANVTGGGTVSGTIIGVGGANVSGTGGVTASVLGQNVSVNGGASQSTLGSSATATASTQSAAQQANSQSQQQVAADQSDGQDDKKKKNTQIRKVGHVTVILASRS